MPRPLPRARLSPTTPQDRQQDFVAQRKRWTALVRNTPTGQDGVSFNTDSDAAYSSVKLSVQAHFGIGLDSPPSRAYRDRRLCHPPATAPSVYYEAPPQPAVPSRARPTDVAQALATGRASNALPVQKTRRRTSRSHCTALSRSPPHGPGQSRPPCPAVNPRNQQVGLARFIDADQRRLVVDLHPAAFVHRPEVGHSELC